MPERKSKAGSRAFIRRALSAGGRRRLILFALVLVWAGVIFAFSAQNGTQSSKTSGRIVTEVIRVFLPDYDSLTQAEQERLLHAVTLAVRKGAHFTEYMILGGLLWGLCRTYTGKKWRTVWVSWMIGSAYAATDELHQMFSDGRTPKVTDAAIDSAGVLCGAALCLAVWCILLCRKKKRRRQYEKVGGKYPEGCALRTGRTASEPESDQTEYK